MLRVVGAAPLSIALAALLLAIFAYQWLTAGPAYSYLTGSGRIPTVMLSYGVIPSFVRGGDWWRLVTAGFLHASVLHIALNLWGLLYAAPFVERWYGRVRLLAIFLGAVVLGDLAAALTSSERTVTVGASGGIVGFFAAVAVVGLRFWSQRDELVRGVLPLFATLFNGLTHPSISNAGHIGGAVAGAALAWVLGVSPSMQNRTVASESDALEASRELEQRLSAPDASAVLDPANTIILRPGWRRRTTSFALAALLITVAGVLLMATLPRLDIVALGSAGLCAVGAVLVVSNAFHTRLELTPAGFTLRALVTRTVLWRDVIPEFVPGSMSGNPMVFYRLRPEVEASKRSFGLLTSGTQNVPAIYGLSAVAQARLMAETYAKWNLRQPEQ